MKLSRGGLLRLAGALLPAALLLPFLLLTPGCGSRPKTGPEQVRWDKVVCVRCIMAVSDRRYAAQVRGGPAGRRARVEFFDDIGCTVLWLDEQPWRDDPRTEIWVTDYRDGSWLDATRAFYEKDKITPMDYGIGARPDSVPGALNWEQARAEIYRREAEFHGAGGPSAVPGS